MMESLPVEMRRKIMDDLSNTELLKISLVNKTFNYEARTLLRGRANLVARLGCLNVLTFLSHLEDMNVVPFTGIKIKWSGGTHRFLCPRPYKKLDPNIFNVLGRMPLKTLSLKFFAGHYVVGKCPVIRLVTKILQDYSGVLEELDVNDRPKLLESVREIIRDSTFPHLKIVKILSLPGEQMGEEGIREDFIKEMKARAPNLQEVKEQDDFTI